MTIEVDTDHSNPAAQTPPVAEPTRLRRLAGPLAASAAVAGAFLILHVRDPHESGSYGYCPFYVLTGKPCPGCGGLRAANLLTKGDIVGAMSSNLMVVVLVVPAVLLYLGAWTYNAVLGRSAPAIPKSRLLWGVIGGAVLVFWIARMTPWGAWLAP
jgi:hypothetical protein